MSKKNTYITIGVIFFIAFLSGTFSYPNYFDKGVDFVNSKFGSHFSHFPAKPFQLGLDLQGGSHLVYEADLSQIDAKDRPEAMAGLRDVIERRVNFFGVREPLVQVQNEKLVVELAGIKDTNEAINMIGKTPYLEFKEERASEETKTILDKQKEIEGKTQEEIKKIPGWELASEDPYFKPTNLTGKYLKKAQVDFDQTSYKPLVLIQFNDEGAKLFEEVTKNNVGKKLAIYIDNIQISAPVVQEAISGGKAQISGRFTAQEAKELARNLNAGALPVPIKLISQQSVGPILGAISLNKSLMAGIYGLIAVILFMILVYRLPGILADISLIIYVALILALFKLIPVTLTLAGIAGFILSIGMAVDANILIFSRMREELKQGKNYIAAIDEGFRRAWPAIRDGNFTTLLVAIIMFGVGTGFVKGFALTLSIGVLVSMFTAITVTRNLLKIFAGTILEKFKWLW